MSNYFRQKEYSGYDGTLLLTETGVIIERGLKGAMFGIVKGDITIPYYNIASVQYRKAGMIAGYIQLTLRSVAEDRRGLLTLNDEYAIHFHAAFGGNNNALFLEAKEIIEERISTAREPIKQMSTSSEPVKISGLDDLEKLAALKEKGIITEEEFKAKKKQILGL